MKIEIDKAKSFEPKCGPRFHCMYCGRFARFIESFDYYNGSFTDIILVWHCAKCGHCKEGIV